MKLGSLVSAKQLTEKQKIAGIEKEIAEWRSIYAITDNADVKESINVRVRNLQKQLLAPQFHQLLNNETFVAGAKQMQSEAYKMEAFKGKTLVVTIDATGAIAFGTRSVKEEAGLATSDDEQVIPETAETVTAE